MRAALGLISLLLVLAVVGLLARKSLTAPGVAPVAQPVPQVGVTAPTTPAQAQQVQEQYRKALEGAMQQARPASGDE
jgi:hypothetical protein